MNNFQLEHLEEGKNTPQEHSLLDAMAAMLSGSSSFLTATP